MGIGGSCSSRLSTRSKNSTGSNANSVMICPGGPPPLRYQRNSNSTSRSLCTSTIPTDGCARPATDKVGAIPFFITTSIDPDLFVGHLIAGAGSALVSQRPTHSTNTRVRASPTGFGRAHRPRYENRGPSWNPPQRRQHPTGTDLGPRRPANPLKHTASGFPEQ